MYLPLTAALIVLGGCGGSGSSGAGSSSVASSEGKSIPDTAKVATTGGSSTPATRGSSAAHGAGKGTSVAAAQVFPASFVQTTNAICSRMNSEFEAHKPKSDALQEIARLSPGRAALERRTVAELGKLAPPARLAGDWRRILGYRRTLAEELQRLGAAAKQGDKGAVAALSVSKKREHEILHQEALRHGLLGCAVVG
jgi:hypothetical protein